MIGPLIFTSRPPCAGSIVAIMQIFSRIHEKISKY